MDGKTIESDARVGRPEPTPDFPRRVSFYPRQALGLAALMIIPILALAGMLGDRLDHHIASHEGLSLRVEAPSSARHGKERQLRLVVQGDPSWSEREVRVEISAEYLDQFGDVRPRPDFEHFAPGVYQFTCRLDAKGEAAPILIDVMPHHYGRARGHARAVMDDHAPVRVDFSTLIFP